MVGVYPEWGRAGLLPCGHLRREILAGTRPGDPIEQASKLTFVINLKTAKALGITVPRALLSLADEVIE
jgi:ABC-type uncharacterized transport system substrate-binding protein